jgi:hypothetical protein
MNLFGKLPQEKAMACLIHDTNSALSSLDFHIKKLSEWHQENVKEYNSSKPFVHLEYLKSKRKEVEKAIDIYYSKFENDFQEPKQAP